MIQKFVLILLVLQSRLPQSPSKIMTNTMPSRKRNLLQVRKEKSNTSDSQKPAASTKEKAS
jgi:hypothetical protein